MGKWLVLYTLIYVKHLIQLITMFYMLNSKHMAALIILFSGLARIWITGHSLLILEALCLVQRIWLEVYHRAPYWNLYYLYSSSMTCHLHLKQCNSDLYADDTTVHTTGKTITEINVKLQCDPASFSNWCACNDLLINVSKTTCMLICTRQRRSYSGNLPLHSTLNNGIIPTCNTQRLLGVNINQNLDCDGQISN